VARRIPLSEAKPRPPTPRQPDTGPETVVSLPPPEQTFEIEILDEPAAPAYAALPTTHAPPQQPKAPARAGLPKWRRGFWMPFPSLAELLVAGVIVQVYLAGAAVFGAVDWTYHTTFIHVVEIIPVAMAVCAFLGGRYVAGWWSLGVLLAIELQYALAHILQLNPTRNLRLLAALHPANALLIFGIALMLAKRYPLWRRPSSL